MSSTRDHALVLVVGALALGLGGCRAATYGASHVVAPVLVGPVRCIGCAPSEPPREGQGDFTDRTLVEDGGYAHTTGFPLLVLKAGVAVPDACRGDIQVTRIHVTSWGGGHAEIELSARAVPIAAGTCARRPWPYAGPKGLVPFDWSVSSHDAAAP